jgi:hypothetical protein
MACRHRAGAEEDGLKYDDFVEGEEATVYMRILMLFTES